MSECYVSKRRSVSVIECHQWTELLIACERCFEFLPSFLETERARQTCTFAGAYIELFKTFGDTRLSPSTFLTVLGSVILCDQLINLQF